MSTSPRLIAIQGIGLTPIAIAVQGLVDGSLVPDGSAEVRQFRAPIVGRGPATTIGLSDYLARLKRQHAPKTQAQPLSIQEQKRITLRKRQRMEQEVLALCVFA